MSEASRITTAVITGGHSHDLLNFRRLFRSLEGIDAYVQHMDDFATSSEEVRDGYDVVLFFIMLTEGPSDEGLPGYAGKPRAVLEHLGETEQGIFVLHHALLAYRQWSVWDEIAGIQDRRFGYHMDQTIQVEIANRHHPITKGLEPWEMVDETYTMNDAGPDSEILMTAEHPKSMTTIAWTRQHRNARVFCFASGHDNDSWSHPSFHQTVTQGIRWVARRI